MPHFTKAWHALGELKSGNQRNLESVLRFLEEDDYRFRSGYLKECCWRILGRASLAEEQKQRLRRVAIQYIHQRMRREFWYMCRFIERVANDAFRTEVRQLAQSAQPDIRQRASLLAAYLESRENGERTRRAFRSKCLSAKYRRHRSPN
jgi:hypothetical protein